MSWHREVFTELAAHYRWRRGVELGVDKGILFAMLLRNCPDLFLIGVDTFPIVERRDRVRVIAAEFADRSKVYEMTTDAASHHVPYGSLDFVFIDADHSETAVTRDIQHWQSKVTRGGWLGGHDYHRKFPGVIAAVDRAFGKRTNHWPGSIWGVWT